MRATEHRVKTEDLERFSIIHFATHGLVSQLAPARSALVLSAGLGDKEDGFLQAREIYNLRLRSDLVILSACRTAREKVLAGEGVEGLAQAFLYAGTKSVVASLWAVNDERTSKLMESFYAHLADGRSKAEALRAAKLDLLRKSSTAEPRYWAAFILIGDANHRVPIQPRRQWVEENRWILAGCLMLSVIALLAPVAYKMSKRRKSPASAFGD